MQYYIISGTRLASSNSSFEEENPQEALMPEDPREEIVSEEELTESSGDELADLNKEYELKRQHIFQKKRSTSEEAAKGNDEKLATDYGKGNNTNKLAEKHVFNRVARQDNGSKFFNKFYNDTKKDIKPELYDQREFSFEIIPKHENNVDKRDEFSQLFLKKEYYSSEQLKVLFNNKKVLRVDKLFAKVAAPLYQEPQYVNWCLIGIVSNKSEPRMTKGSGHGDKQRKYMKISISNLRLSVDLMLFGDAFSMYWKLKVGDVIAILNPSVNPWGTPYRGFNLSLNDGSNSIIEIGSARDFGYCNMLKRDNTPCRAIINLRESDVCHYHQHLKYSQSQSKRMELNGSVGMKSPTGKDGKKKSMYMSVGSDSRVAFETLNEQSEFYAHEPGRNKGNYHDPQILQNLKAKRRKYRDNRENAKLEAKLSELPNGRKFERLGLIKREPAAEATNNHAHESAFHSNFLNKVGFDPAKSPYADSADAITGMSQKKKQIPAAIKELYQLSSEKSGKRKLKRSTRTKEERKAQQEQIFKDLEQYRNRYTKDQPKNENSSEDEILSPLRKQRKQVRNKHHPESPSKSYPVFTDPKVVTSKASNGIKLFDSQKKYTSDNGGDHHGKQHQENENRDKVYHLGTGTTTSPIPAYDKSKFNSQFLTNKQNLSKSSLSYSNLLSTPNRTQANSNCSENISDSDIEISFDDPNAERSYYNFLQKLHV